LADTGKRYIYEHHKKQLEEMQMQYRATAAG
jgi:hypothetical protein